jgi:Protein of unknown function (DUF1538).
MNLLAKIKETSISVVPILLIVLVLGTTIAPIGFELLAQFCIGGVMIILGLSVFLLGADLGVLPVGQNVGAALVHKRSLGLMLGVGFLVGFLITVAEPDIQVLANQVSTVDPSIPKMTLIVMIALGVGLFVATGFGRVILGIPYSAVLILFYAAVFALAAFTSPSYLGIAFDAGGATTGPMTVPFIIALGVGVAGVRAGKDSEKDSFGLVGLASIGPILAVLIMGILNKEAVSATAASGTDTLEPVGLGAFLALVPETTMEVARALGPLVLLFLVFQLVLLHMPPHQVAKVGKGLIYTFIGLLIFLVGVNGGFMPVGSAIGSMIGSKQGMAVLVPIGVILGAVVVLAEPAVWVLTKQVEDLSSGHIKKRLMLASLSVGVAIAVGIAMVRVLTGLSIWWFLIPGYTLAIILTFACPPLFTAIAFDSGGVASGPMSSTFILAFMIGVSRAAGGNPITDAFGVIAMIAMMPLITIQVLGILFSHKEKRAAEARAGEAAKGYGHDGTN